MINGVVTPYCDIDRNEAIALLVLSAVFIPYNMLFYGNELMNAFNASTKMLKSIYVPYMCTFLFAILWNVLNLISCIIILSPKCDKFIRFLEFKNWFMPVSVYFGIGNIYLLYLYRLKFSFIYTSVKVSKLKFHTLLLLYFIQMFFGISIIIINISGILNTKLLLALAIVGGSIYEISSILLIILFVKKTIQLTKDKPPTHEQSLIQLSVHYISSNYMLNYFLCTPNIIRLANAVKYLNCASFTSFFEIITMIIMCSLILRNATQKSVFKCYILLTINAHIGVFLLHLQFTWMHKCYILLCNPFRIEINSAFNKFLKHMALSVSETPSESTLNTTESKTKTSTAIPSGLEPTKTDASRDYPKNLQPTSDSIHYQFNDIKPGTIKTVYLCLLCPIVLN